MKKLVVFLLMPVISFAQIQKNERGTVYFEKVYDVPGMEKAAIKSAVHEWLALTFNDANQVIKMNTDDKIINKGLVRSNYEWSGVLVDLTNEFDMITEFKDEKYRLTIDNITYRTPDGDSYEISWGPEDLSKEAFRKSLQEMIDNMEEGQVKTINERILKSEKKFDQHYNTAVLARKKIYESVIPEIEIIAGSLALFIKDKTKSEEDW